MTSPTIYCPYVLRLPGQDTRFSFENTHTHVYIYTLAIGIRAIQSVYTHTEDSRDTHDVFQVAFRAMIDKCFDVRFEFRGTMMIKAIEINGRVAPELLDSLSGK